MRTVHRVVKCIRNCLFKTIGAFGGWMTRKKGDKCSVPRNTLEDAGR